MGRIRKQIIRDRNLTPAEAEKYRRVRQQIEFEKPEIIRRVNAERAAETELLRIFGVLKEIRNEKGLSLADLTEATGIDRASISKLESGQRANPTLATVSKYAAALGKKVVVSVVVWPFLVAVSSIGRQVLPSARVVGAASGLAATTVGGAVVLVVGSTV